MQALKKEEPSVKFVDAPPPSTNAFTHYSVHRFAVTTACSRVIASLPFALVGTRLQRKLLHGDITAGTPLY